MVRIYGSFSTGKTSYLREYNNINAVDTDIFYYMYTGALKRNTFAYLEDANAWSNMALIIKQMRNVSLLLTNNYGPLNDVLGKFQLAFVSSQSRLESMLSTADLSPELTNVLTALIAREAMYLGEYATDIVTLQKDQYISDYHQTIQSLIKGDHNDNT